jgi:hypothetical protein
MANVLNRITKEFRASVNTPDFPSAQWIVNPNLSAVLGFPSKYWIITGDVVTLQTQPQRDVTDDAEFQASATIADGEAELFGDGNDGNMVISANQPLTQDIYPRLLTINAGIILDTGGFRIVAKTGVFNFGGIRDNGAAAVGAVAGTGGPAGTLGGGGNGATGTNGVGATAVSLNVDATPGYGGRGGDGGAGGAGAGGGGGAIRSDANSRVRPRRLTSIEAMSDIDALVAGGLVRFQGGGGGGSGAGNGGANLGGAGGRGGGIVMIVAPFIFNDPAAFIQALGGAGGNATGTNSGGGGSGGGGIIATVTGQLRDRGVRSVAGGAAGTATGTGVVGSVGNNGRMINVRVR